MNDVHDRPGSSAERRAALRAAVLDAADRAISAHGLDALRARDLAQEAGCSVGAIYTVFADLDALILAVNGRTLEALGKALSAVRNGEDPVEELAALAIAYLDYAISNRPRWAALFTHRMAGERPVPDWYAAMQNQLFRYVGGPLSRLRPDLRPKASAQLARTLFSAVHGVTALGLDEKLAPLSPTALREQLLLLVRACGHGLCNSTKSRASKARS